jgi:phosphoglycerate kinase
LAMQDEIQAMQSAFTSPKRPIMGVLGGAKLSTKLPILKALLPKLDGVLIGGAMAHPFLKAQGSDIGTSWLESESMISVAQNLLQHYPNRMHLPIDAINACMQPVRWDQWSNQDAALDIGPNTIQAFQSQLSSAKTILWNGPLGCYEDLNHQSGTQAIGQWIAQQTSSGVVTVVGGGDTVAALHQCNLSSLDFSHVSNAGGAFLAWLEHGTLPGIQALMHQHVSCNHKAET